MATSTSTPSGIVRQMVAACHGQPASSRSRIARRETSGFPVSDATRCLPSSCTTGQSVGPTRSGLARLVVQRQPTCFVGLCRGRATIFASTGVLVAGWWPVAVAVACGGLPFPCYTTVLAF